MFNVGDIVDHASDKAFKGGTVVTVNGSLVRVKWTNNSNWMSYESDDNLTLHVKAYKALFKIGDLVDHKTNGALYDGRIKGITANPGQALQYLVDWNCYQNLAYTLALELESDLRLTPVFNVGDRVAHVSHGYHDGEIIWSDRASRRARVNWAYQGFVIGHDYNELSPIVYRLSPIGKSALTIPPAINVPNSQVLNDLESKPQCECGAHKVGSNNHSAWCAIK